MQNLSTIKRATVGMSALGWIALACLLLNAAFWGSFMLDLLRPPSPLSPQAIQAGLATAAFALVLPLFWSMLLPSSPAGRLLQRQTWRLPGHLAVTFGAAFLTWLAWSYLRAWWAGQPEAVAGNSDVLLAITSLIPGVLVPALSWCVMTPEQWVAQLEQARHVKRLEHAMRMEEAAMKAAYAYAVSLLNADLCNLSIEQRRELAGILGAFARTQQQALASIAASWKDMYGVEAKLATVPDQELLASYEKVAGLLAGSADIMKSSADYASEVHSRTAVNGERRMTNECTSVPPSPAHQDAEWDESQEAGTIPIRAPHGHRPIVPEPPYRDAYAHARAALDGAWKRGDLERALSISRSSAHRYLQAWQDAGLVNSLTEPHDHYGWG